MKTTVPLLCSVLVCLSACVAPVVYDDMIDYYELESGTLQKVRDMQVLPGFVLATGIYSDLGVVEGTHCQLAKSNNSRTSSRVAVQEAQDQVKIRAAIKGADAVSPPRCRFTISPTKKNGCYRKTECRSNAYRRSTTAI